MKTSMLIAALTFAATAATLAASPAAAQPSAAGAVPVSYADLDLRTESGIRALDRRILSAVQEACGPTSDFDLAGNNRVRECRADVLARLSEQRQAAIAAATRNAPVQLAAQR